jgi:hypothetical protein
MFHVFLLSRAGFEKAVETEVLLFYGRSISTVGAAQEFSPQADIESQLPEDSMADTRPARWEAIQFSR